MEVMQLKVQGRRLLSGSPRELQNGKAALLPGFTNELGFIVLSLLYGCLWVKLDKLVAVCFRSSFLHILSLWNLSF